MLVSTGLKLELSGFRASATNLATALAIGCMNPRAMPSHTHTQEGPAKSAEVLDDCSGGSLVSRRPALDTMPHRSPGVSRELTHEISSA